MLPKKLRLHKKSLDYVFKRGLAIRSPNLSLRFIKGVDGKTGFSFIVPKTVLKNSSQRNFLRRRGYAVLDKHISILPFPIFGVFVFNKDSPKIFGGKKTELFNPFKNLEKEIITILHKI